MDDLSNGELTNDVAPAEESQVVESQIEATEKVTTDNIDEGTIQRLRQDLDKNKKFLSSLGIDPESDVADKLQAGVISRDEVLNKIVQRNYPQYQPQQQYQPQYQPPQPQVNPTDILQEAIQKASRDELSQSDLAKTFKVLADTMQDYEHSKKSTENQQKMMRCLSEVDNVVKSSKDFNDLPDDIKNIERNLVIGATDFMVTRENVDPTNPNVYKYFAQNVQKQIEGIKNHYYQLGLKAANQPRPSANVKPISSNIGSAPVQQPTVRPTLDTLDKRAKMYLNNQFQP